MPSISKGYNYMDQVGKKTSNCRKSMYIFAYNGRAMATARNWAIEKYLALALVLSPSPLPLAVGSQILNMCIDLHGGLFSY